MIKIPPVLLILIGVVSMWLINRFISVWQFALPFQTLISTLLLSVGFIITFAGVWLFRKATTTVDPLNPEHSSQLVTTGIYQFTRNPMYLGMLLVLLSWMIYLGSVLNTIVVILFIWFINKYQIPQEEKALRKIFGERYQEYFSRVRRWM